MPVIEAIIYSANGGVAGQLNGAETRQKNTTEGLSGCDMRLK